MRVPKLESTTPLNRSGLVLSLDPQAFQTLPTQPPRELLAHLHFGLEQDDTPPLINIRFPQTSHTPIGTPIVFDVCLRKPAFIGDIPQNGCTFNRYRLDIQGFKCGTPQDASEVKCSLTVLETFTLKNGPKSIFLLPQLRRADPLDTVNPSNPIGLVIVQREEGQRRAAFVSDPLISLAAFFLIPHEDINNPHGQLERERALSHMGSAHINRPTTASVQLVTLYTFRERVGFVERVICGNTGRGVTRDARFKRTPLPRGGRGRPTMPKLYCTYTVSDYVYR